MKNYTDIPINETPFSRYGSYLALGHKPGANKLTVHYAKRRFGQDEAFELCFMRSGKPAEIKIEALPYVMHITSDVGSARIFIRDDYSLVIDSAGLDISLKLLSKHGYGHYYGKKDCKIIDKVNRCYAAINIQKGTATLDGPVVQNPQLRKAVNARKNFSLECERGTALMALEISQNERVLDISDIDVDEEIGKVKNEWSEFLSKMPAVPEKHAYYSVLAWYTTWSCFVRANDTYKYDTVLMSMQHMSSVWTWDHCFNALILSYVDPQAALEQLLLPFEVQAESGALPDMWNPNDEIVWGVTKPPIHGWCFNKMMDRHEYSQEVYAKVYSHLSRWTDWWMTFRDTDKDGIPEYPQGCDSGWDGSSLFEIGYFLESPDLPAFLVLQMNTLARIAEKLGKTAEAANWRQRGEKMLADLYAHSWEDDRFVAKLSGSHEYDPNPRSSLALMPIILGSLLDKDKADRLAELLDQDYIGENGISGAFEFDDDGNKIKGSIWASQVYLFTDGLLACGHKDKAMKAAEGFVNMIETKATSHYEGFEADGRSIGVPGYTWTSSVYLLYVWEYFSSKTTRRM